MAEQEMISIKINGKDMNVPAGTLVYQAAKQAGFIVPTLCYHPDVPQTGSCGICMVQVEGGRMVRACNMKAQAGKNYLTHTPAVLEVRRNVLKEILEEHPRDCLGCRRSGSCELQNLAIEFNLRDRISGGTCIKEDAVDGSCSVVFDTRYCVHCTRCIQVCSKIQGVSALELVGTGEDSRVRPVGGGTLAESPCVKCGQCAAHCPVNAIREHEDIVPLRKILAEKTHYVTVQIAPAVRVSLGEAFGMPVGDLVTGKVYAALRMLGFNAVFDTSFGADLTVMEEATEFLNRVKTPGAVFPMITTCCPSWVEYMERFYDDMIPHFSSCKSPMMMTGAIVKTYYAKKKELDPKSIFNVAIMPCTSKKEEIQRKEMKGKQPYGDDVDMVITTRELARMIKEAGIDFVNLPDEQPDDFAGDYSGAGVIFGATGGVLEASLRTAAHLAGEKLENLEFQALRGLEGVKETTINIAGKEIKIAVTHGLGNIKKVLDKVRACKENGEEMPWHFMEVMACAGGCISGGGQIYSLKKETRLKRIEGIYKEDRIMPHRCSHDNPSIQELYKNFLHTPGSHEAHELLHTHYIPRPVAIQNKK
ncbi:MAG: [FeFe] hydrogenase, group A [Spirochaetia bacterium]